MSSAALSARSAWAHGNEANERVEAGSSRLPSDWDYVVAYLPKQFRNPEAIPRPPQPVQRNASPEQRRVFKAANKKHQAWLDALAEARRLVAASFVQPCPSTSLPVLTSLDISDDSSSDYDDPESPHP